MSLLGQPPEMILEQLKALPVGDAMKLCQGNSELSRLCEDSRLWYSWAKRDFSYIDPFPPFDPAADARALYRDMFDAEKERRNRLRIQINMAKHGRYCSPPGHGFYNLQDTLNMRPTRHPKKEEYDRFVFWPDYNVAGTINQIVKAFRAAGMNMVKVGELDQMTDGQAGDSPGEYPLSEELVSINSIDPQNDFDRMIIRGLFV